MNRYKIRSSWIPLEEMQKIYRIGKLDSNPIKIIKHLEVSNGGTMIHL